jgi:hypothetical protein
LSEEGKLSVMRQMGIRNEDAGWHLLEIWSRKFYDPKFLGKSTTKISAFEENG